jgi:hypothetical protein
MQRTTKNKLLTITTLKGFQKAVNDINVISKGKTQKTLIASSFHRTLFIKM